MVTIYGLPPRIKPASHWGTVLVDTGAELSWIPADVLESAFIDAAGTSTTDEVVFREPQDLVLLGSRSLGGSNLRIDPVAKTLVDGGPVPAAVAG